jgi:multiple sugar transport system substrate-binding protein
VDRQATSRKPVPGESAGPGVAMATRRQFLGRAARTAVAVGLGPAVLPRPGRARASTLRIAQWAHFVPGYDDWFDHTFAKAWAERNGVRVEVDHVAVSQLRPRAAAEVAAQRGHDLFGLLESPVLHEAHTEPLTEVVADCERRFGRMVPLCHRATYNPQTKQYYAFPDCWAPMPLHYRTDWWGEVGIRPDTWENVRDGARKIREKLGVPAGFGLAPENDSNMMLRGLLWSFGASEQDEAGQVTINSPATLEALRFMTAVYRESMTSDVFVWDSSSNNRAFVWGRASVIQNAISALRQAEKQSPSVAKSAALARAAAGPAARLMAPNVIHCYVIWKFAENADLARRFLVDLVAAYDDAFQTSEFYNFPAFSKAVRNLRGRLAADRQSPQSYVTLADADTWTVAPGHPGYQSPAIEETRVKSVIPKMFARAARGEQSPRDAVSQAEAEMKRIFARRAQRWEVTPPPR